MISENDFVVERERHLSDRWLTLNALEQKHRTETTAILNVNICLSYTNKLNQANIYMGS